MAKIDVYTNELASLSSRLKKISSAIADAESAAANVQRNLNFQVAAKSGIDSGITKARNSLKKQNTKVTSLSNLTAVSNEEFMSADRQMDKKAQNIVGKIMSPTGNIAHAIQGLFVGASLAQYGAVGALFLAGGSIFGAASVVPLAGLIQSLSGNRFGNGTASAGSAAGGHSSGGGRHDGNAASKPEFSGAAVAGAAAAGIMGVTGITGAAAGIGGAAGGHSSGGGRHDGNAASKPEFSGAAAAGAAVAGAAGIMHAGAANSAAFPESTPEAGEPALAKYDNLVSFPMGDYAGKTAGDYSGYSIVGGMNPAYCYNQSSGIYTEKGFNKGGCLACADACVGSIMGKGGLNPESLWNESTGECKCVYTTRVGLGTKNDSCSWTPEQIREKAYEELVSGRPVIVRVQSGTSAGGGHSVAVVGLRDGADPNHLTDADFLIMDPADGKIKALSDRVKVKGKDTCLKPDQANAGMRRVK